MAKLQGELRIYSEPDFEGNEHVLMESDNNLKKTFNSKISSAIVRGNPWILYEKEQCQGSPLFLEEGKYSVIPSGESNFLSAKFLPADLKSPQIFVYSSTDFRGESEWEKCGPEDQAMKSVSVGMGGIWGIRAKDDSVWMRTIGSNKLDPGESSCGESWNRMNGGLRQLSVGQNTIWGINGNGSISVRVGIGKESPGGKEWVAVDGESMKHVSVSNKGHVWAVDDKDKIWYRKGACIENVLGSGWKTIPGSLKQLSVSYCGVWGINSNQEVWYRLNTAMDPDNEGTGWVKVDGRFQQIFGGPKTVLGLTGNRDIYYRSGLSSSDQGSHWIRIEQEKDSKIVFKHIECHEDSFWCVDTNNHVWFKSKLYEDTGKHTYIALNRDTSSFSSYSFPLKAATYKVNKGGWAIYSDPNYEGKVMYQINGDCYSNDPMQKNHPWKSWFQLIGSVRPIRGLNYETIAIKAHVDWENAEVETIKNIVSKLNFKNDTAEYALTNWDITKEVTKVLSHSISFAKESKIPDELHLNGEEFELESIDTINFPIEYPIPDLITSQNFLKELHFSPFTINKELKSMKILTTSHILNLPNLAPPHTDCTLKIISYKNQITAPVSANVRKCFKDNFVNGYESWTLHGQYTGIDETHLKIELEFKEIPQPRKISKMLSGLGVLDM
ncbi:uncharacterized protein [Lepeophtheirus salmonis]|uniref:uncharacterized protein n=1 Tax=Lepeophtheirus salmonis TaxID=72036 RepID=UPI003AF3ACA3